MFSRNSPHKTHLRMGFLLDRFLLDRFLLINRDNNPAWGYVMQVENNPLIQPEYRYLRHS